MIFQMTEPSFTHLRITLSTFYVRQNSPFHRKLLSTAALDTTCALDSNDFPVQLLYIQFLQHTRGMNYHLVATVTPLMQKKNHAAFWKMMILWFDFDKPSHWWRGGEKEKDTRGRKDWENEMGLTRSDWQPCFSQFGSLLPLCFCEGSRNTSSAIHFISIPTPASHLHSVSFTSSFLFSACHYISWMITQWQFHWPSTGLDTALPASKTAKVASLCYKHADFSCFFFQKSFSPSPTVPLLLSGFHQRPTPAISWPNPDPCYVTLTRPRTAQWLPRGPLFGSYVSPLHGNKWASRSIVTMISCRRCEWGTT